MNKKEPLNGQLISREIVYSMHEFCYACNVTPEIIVLLVDHGIVDVEGILTEQREQWSFHGEALLRGQRALRLVRDLGVNWAGAALALDLLEQLERNR